MLHTYVTYLVTMHPKEITVRRRYSDFDDYYTLLVSRYPAMVISPLPPKQVVNNTADETILYRMKGMAASGGDDQPWARG